MQTLPSLTQVYQPYNSYSVIADNFILVITHFFKKFHSSFLLFFFFPKSALLPTEFILPGHLHSTSPLLL